MKGIRILYLEDDETLAFLTGDHLAMQGYEVVHVTNGNAALEHLNTDRFDLCILDIMVPGPDGMEVAGHLRRTDKRTPIIFLSARTLAEDRIAALRIGADDYLVKPFRIEELVLRIEVFLRRSGIIEEDIEEFGCRDVLFRPGEYKMYVGAEEIKLTARETELLSFLWKNANKILKREDILLAIWGDDDYFLGRSLDVFVSRLRKKFGESECIGIENVHGVGFRFRADDQG